MNTEEDELLCPRRRLQQLLQFRAEALRPAPAPCPHSLAGEYNEDNILAWAKSPDSEAWLELLQRLVFPKPGSEAGLAIRRRQAEGALLAREAGRFVPEVYRRAAAEFVRLLAAARHNKDKALLLRLHRGNLKLGTGRRARQPAVLAALVSYRKLWLNHGRRPSPQAVLDHAEMVNGSVDKRNWRREVKKLRALWG